MFGGKIVLKAISHFQTKVVATGMP